MQPTPINIYCLLFAHFGSQNWWPMDLNYHTAHHSDPRFEVIIGAILTQNTAWTNVEMAIVNLKNEHLLSIDAINQVNCSRLKSLIKPSGFYNQKADRLKSMSFYLDEVYQGNLDQMFSQPFPQIRKQLLAIKGVGPETADSILLYAGEKPVFVVDAYTKRLCRRLPLSVNASSYPDIQQLFQTSLSKTYDSLSITSIYNECHALIVEWAKTYCMKRRPMCLSCPLSLLCTYKDSQ